MNDSDSVCVRAIYGSHSPFEIWNAQKIRSSNHKKTPRAPRTLDNDDDVRYIKAIYKGYIKAIEEEIAQLIFHYKFLSHSSGSLKVMSRALQYFSVAFAVTCHMAFPAALLAHSGLTFDMKSSPE